MEEKMNEFNELNGATENVTAENDVNVPELEDETAIEDVVDVILENDDFNEDDLIIEENAEEDFLEDSAPAVKSNKTSYFGAALRSLIFGGLSVIIPLFALILMCTGAYLVSAVVGAGAIALAIVALVSSSKKKAIVDDYSKEMLKMGKILSIIGLVVSGIVLAYTAIQIAILILTVGSMILMYAFLFIIAILTSL